MIGLHSWASASHAYDLLRQAQNELGRVRAVAQNPDEAHVAYSQWANIQSRTLASVLRPDEVDRLVTSKRYWLLQSIDPSSHRLTSQIVSTEIEERAEAFANEIFRLQQEMDRWNVPGLIALIPDTNVLLEHYGELNEFAWTDGSDAPSNPTVIVVLMAVLNELDSLKLSRTEPKKGKAPIRTRATGALRWVKAHIDQPLQRVELKPRRIENEWAYGQLFLTVVGDPLDHAPLPLADAEIVDRASLFAPFTTDVRVLTYDTAMVFRARQAGLRAQELQYPDD